LDCSKIIAGALVDIWHANDAGDYDNDEGLSHKNKKPRK